MGAKGVFTRRPHVVPGSIAPAMLVAALAAWPYGYYVLLRWVTCAAAVFTTYQAWAWKRTWAVCLFAPMAILFNPLAPVHMTQEVWRPVDLMAAGVFIVGIFTLADRTADPCDGRRENDD